MQRHLRLRQQADFQRVRRTGQSWAHPLLILACVPNGLEHNRYGIITSRRVGNAVIRNRTKRRIREAVRHWHPHVTAGYDIVLIARSPVLRSSHDELLDAIAVVLRRANLV